jgi:hypothetical protein
LPIGINKKCTNFLKTQLRKKFNPNYTKETNDKGLGFDKIRV